MFENLVEVLKANPRKIVYTEGSDARILESAARLKKEGFLTPVLVGNVEEVKAAAAKDFNVPVLGSDGLDGIAGQIAGSAIKASIEYISPFDVNSTDPKISAFVSAYKAKYNKDPDQFAADGYDAIMILYAAMQKAGITDVTMSASDMTDLIKPLLTSKDFSYTGITGTMSWSADGSCNKDPIMVKVN